MLKYIALALIFYPGLLMAQTIGVIVPIEHAAFTDMVAGLTASLRQNSKDEEIKIIVKNAQGDANLQRAIIQQMQTQKVDVFVPIGTAATQMTLAMEKKSPVVALAALYTEQERQKQQPVHMTGVLDEIPVQKHLAVMEQLLSPFTEFSLVYSNSEKVFHDVETLSVLSKEDGIHLQKMMIQHLPELYVISRQLAPKSQAIFVLKDPLISSGILTLVREAEKRKIPVIASDEGSVKQGAAIALGVSEREIGEQGGRLVMKVLDGQPLADLPLERMNKYFIFFNTKTSKAQNLDLQQVEKVAKKLGYEVKEIQP